MIDLSMLKISPKLISVEGNRVGTDDKLHRNTTKKDLDGYKDDEILYYDSRTSYNETSRFPTQLFTNIKNDRYKYVKNIT